MTGLIGGFIVVDKGVLMDIIYLEANFDDVTSEDICYWRHLNCYWMILE